MIKIRERISNLVLAIILIISAIIKILIFDDRDGKFKFIVISIAEIIIALFNIGLVIEENFLPEPEKENDNE